jgi:hypothetical protein
MKSNYGCTWEVMVYALAKWIISQPACTVFNNTTLIHRLYMSHCKMSHCTNVTLYKCHIVKMYLDGVICLDREVDCHAFPMLIEVIMPITR